jgi:glucans biosynthesis protein
MVTRRDLLTYTSFSMALAALGFTPAVFAAQRLKLADSVPFTFEGLIKQAKDSAKNPYVAPEKVPDSAVASINYDVYSKVLYKPEYALFNEGVSRFPVTFFPVSSLHHLPVKMSVVENMRAREIIQNADYFTFPDNNQGVLSAVKGNVFSGFRVLEHQQSSENHGVKDWVSFLGASYFRAVGELEQFGLSARGIAVNTVFGDTKEEFPDFTHFWFEASEKDRDHLVVYALLDGPSVCGAYRFDMQRTKGVVMDVECSLFLRRDIGRLGIAPQTSMFWFSEMAKGSASDWRPEVHDSDGLAVWTSTDEHIWRPLNNPLQIRVSAFSDNNPRGFGLSQKQRKPDSYLGSAGYERRPDLWVEPKGDWGKGAVQLVEIPTDDEIFDNIAAMWVPEQPAKAGSEYQFSYRLHWLADEPYPSKLARCGITRMGRGGNPGAYPDPDARKFMVEFQGDVLEHLAADAHIDAVVTASRGTLKDIRVEKSPAGKGSWRTFFDLHAEGKEPVELRLYLKSGDKTLSETWMYQYLPFTSSPKPMQGV